ncbi:MAG: gamma-glutamyltransferase family protein [Oceanospirillales bacterium]|nr:MAG: gamma-glutamyltransferase family protein [Oceanospirillales bacterium]
MQSTPLFSRCTKWKGLTFSALLLLGSSGSLHAYDAAIAPEAGSGLTNTSVFQAQTFAVAAANPLATEAGYKVLRAGGSAVDAAIAVQAMLTLVEPQSSGIGGGAFLLLSSDQGIQAFDGRETAPAAATGDLFLNDDGEPLAFMEAAASGRSVGVPGLLKMLELAHQQHGVLDWADLFASTIQLAEEGFPVSARLHTLLSGETHLKEDPLAAVFYYDNGEALPEGYILKNPALAAILRQIAEQGSQAFYQGDIADDMINRVQNHPAGGGGLSHEDLLTYQAVVRDPICTPWKVYDVCGFPPPSSGHLTIMQMLGMLEYLPVDTAVQQGEQSVDWLHRFIEVARLSFADRALYIADPEFVDAPGGDWTAMLNPNYLSARASLVGSESMGSGGAKAGNPQEFVTAFAPQPDQVEYGTSHISIVDGMGNALAMTTTIEAAFGARILADGGTGLAGGYLLNNELTDFSFRPEDAEGRLIANRIEPGKRPRSSMSPTLVFDAETGDWVASLGSPGGAAIIHYTARSLIALLDWQLEPSKVVELPHTVTLGGPVWLEADRFSPETLSALEMLGHDVSERELTSGIQLLINIPEGITGAADPRREGRVMGD